MTLGDVEGAAGPILAGVAEAAVRGLALAAIAGAGLAVLRVRGNSARLWTWTLVLYAALAMPVLDRVLPRLSLPVPAFLQAALTPTAVAPSQTGAPSAPSLVASRSGTSTPTSAATALPASDGSLSSLALLAAFAIYTAGVSLMLLRAAVGWRMANRLRRHAQPIADSPATARLARLAVAGGLSRPPTLAEHDRLSVPVVLGLMRPAIVLPSDWPSWPPAKLDAVLAHEIAHVVNRDARALWLSHLHRAVFWFSPLSWWLPRRLTQLMELVNDDAALAAGASPTVYAEALLDFFSRIRHARGRAAWQLAMARHGRGAVQRVERVLAWTDRDRAQATARRSVLVGLALLAATASVFAAAVGPAAAPAAEQLALPAMSTSSDAATLRRLLDSPPATHAETRPASLQAPHPALEPPAMAIHTDGAAPDIVKQAEPPVAQSPSPTPAPAPAPKHRLQGSYYWQQSGNAPPQFPVVSQDPIVQRQVEAQLQPVRLDPKLMSLRTNKDVAPTIGRILDGLVQSGILTARYAPDATNLDQPASVDLANTTLEGVLHALFDGRGVTFEPLGPKAVFIYPDTAANREKYTAVIRTFELAKADVRVLSQQLNQVVRPTDGFRPTIVSVSDARTIVVRAIPELMSQIAKFIAENDKDQ